MELGILLMTGKTTCVTGVWKPEQDLGTLVRIEGGDKLTLVQSVDTHDSFFFFP